MYKSHKSCLAATSQHSMLQLDTDNKISRDALLINPLTGGTANLSNGLAVQPDRLLMVLAAVLLYLHTGWSWDKSATAHQLKVV